MIFDPRIHVEIVDLITNSEVAELFGTSVAAVSNWKKRFPNYPKPIRTSKSGRGTIYRKREILLWYGHAFPSRMDAARALIDIIDS